MKFPAALFAANASDDEPVAPASLDACCTIAITAWPCSRTTPLPVVKNPYAITASTAMRLHSRRRISPPSPVIPDLMNPGGGAIQTRATCGFPKEEPLISVFCQQIQPVGRRSRVTGSPVRCVSDNDKRVTVVFERNAE